MFFILLAHDKPGSLELRRQTKQRHMAHLDAAAPSLRVLQSGPLLSAEGAEHGSLLVFEAPDAGTVDAFVKRDPYVAAGLFESYEIHPWAWRRGNPYLSDAERSAKP